VGVGEEGAPEFGAWPTLEAPRVAYEARGRQTRLGLVAAGLGISVVPGLAADTVPQGVKWLRVEDPAFVLGRQTAMVTAHDASAGARAMLQAMREEITGLATESQPAAMGPQVSEERPMPDVVPICRCVVM
jgi:DNA-binding transcriptional LysR family regulator